VPGAEYDRDPRKIEFQARAIASLPRLLALARDLMALVGEQPEDAPPEIRRLYEEAQKVERYIREVPAAPEPSSVQSAA
jgi:hypothetical protein